MLLFAYEADEVSSMPGHHGYQAGRSEKEIVPKIIR